MIRHAILTHNIGFLVLGSTGCSCCRYENFAEGIHENLEAAQASVTAHIANKTCASQYSATGRYDIREISYEVLEEGGEKRFIIGSHLLDSNVFLESGEEEHNNYSYIGRLISTNLKDK